MKMRKSMIFIISLLCGVMVIGCGKKEPETQSGTISVIREEETEAKEQSDGLTEFDPFEGIYPSFSGISPDGTASIVYKNKTNPMRYFYNIEPHSDLRNGDVVKISINDDDPEKTANEHGYTLLETEKEFVVEGLDYYVEAIDEITDELQDEMIEQVSSHVRADVKRYNGDVSLSDCKLIGYYLLSQSTRNYDINNFCYGVYEITVTCPERDISYFYCARFTNIVIKSNGGYKITMGADDVSSDVFYEGDYRIKGCSNLDEIYEACVADWCWDTETYDLETNMPK